MTNKYHHELVTPSLLELATEIQKLSREGYSISYGPEYFGCVYIVQFKKDGDEEAVEVVPTTQLPAAPAEAKAEVHKRGPKAKAKAVPKEEPVEA